jgi:hypothetical protein
MQLQPRSSFINKLRVASSLTMALLLLNSCATTIHDGPFCSLVPVLPNECEGSRGAVCDNFLTHAPQTLTGPQWKALQASWLAQGYSTEATNSLYASYLKEEIEQFCSTSSGACTVAQQNLKNALVGILTRMEWAGHAAKALPTHPELLRDYPASRLPQILPPSESSKESTLEELIPDPSPSSAPGPQSGRSRIQGCPADPRAKQYGSEATTIAERPADVQPPAL